MKEIVDATEKAFLKIPEGLRNWATIQIATYYLQFGRNHAIHTPKQRWWAQKMTACLLNGEATSQSYYATKLFDEADFNITGADVIKESGGIVIVNYSNEGLVRGNWIKYVLNHAIAEAKSKEGLYEARWVQKEESEKPLIKHSPLQIQKRWLSSMMNRSCNTFLITHQASLSKSKRIFDEMAGHLEQDGIIVICPEGGDNRVLGRGRVETARLIRALTKRADPPIFPVGAFSDEKLNIRFGKRMSIADFSNTCATDQQISDRMMVEIAKLLPESKRGVYRQAANRQTEVRSILI